MILNNDPVVIAAAYRTAIGSMLGVFKDLSAAELGAVCIKHLLKNTSFDHPIDEVLMGCVLTAGQRQAPARQAALKANLSQYVGATTLNKMCGSGMKTIMLAHDMLIANPERILIAGGMESMSRAPYLLFKARNGYRLGHGDLIDHLFYDGLEDAYENKLMGWFADQTAAELGFTREQQDEFAIRSLERARQAIEKGLFAAEIAPVIIQNNGIATSINQDEQPQRAKIEKIPQLKPAFNERGTVTAANSSSISDGASALLLMRRSLAEKLNLPQLAIIKGYASYAQQPSGFTTAPAHAIQRLIEKINWNLNDIDLFEINEAFAVVTLAAMQALNLPVEKVNVHGGACALGHPIGASGARIVTTLLYALKHYGLKRGIATLCIGGGEATALAIEC